MASGLLVIVAVGLVALVHRSGVDAAWRAWFIDRRSGTLDAVFTVVSTVGSAKLLIPVALATAIPLAVRGHRRDALLASVTALGAVAVGFLLKAVIERPRPAEGHLTAVHSHAFPSGHSLTSIAVIGVLVVLAWRHLPAPAARSATVAGAVLVVAVGVSRVYLGVHWPTDVLAGWLVGGLWLGLCVVVSSGRGRAAR